MAFELERRKFLAALAAAPLIASAGALSAAAPSVAAGWPKGSLWKLPAHSGSIALTVDDGISYDTVSKYIDFVEKYNHRLTFFVTSRYSTWTKVQHKLQPFVTSGQIQLGNHTVNHPNLNTLSASKIHQELTGCQKFIHDHYGVEVAPYFRPPYGYINDYVVKAAADAGFTKPVLWLGSFGDSTPTSASDVLKLANTWLTEGRIVIGHANQPTITHLFPQIDAILKKRHLKTVTLKDVFG
jgi:peptidoglycan/xylan/chitin deacetylase (PgdA/CDA1 family)